MLPPLLLRLHRARLVPRASSLYPEATVPADGWKSRQGSFWGACEPILGAELPILLWPKSTFWSGRRHFTEQLSNKWNWTEERVFSSQEWLGLGAPGFFSHVARSSGPLVTLDITPLWSSLSYVFPSHWSGCLWMSCSSSTWSLCLDFWAAQSFSSESSFSSCIRKRVGFFRFSRVHAANFLPEENKSPHDVFLCALED